MSNIFDELKEQLELDYLSDIRFISRTEIMRITQELSESGSYSEKEIQMLIEYATT